eukprot:9468111-Pyramimonas_sp.AAC.3
MENAERGRHNDGGAPFPVPSGIRGSQPSVVAWGVRKEDQIHRGGGKGRGQEGLHRHRCCRARQGTTAPTCGGMGGEGCPIFTLNPNT